MEQIQQHQQEAEEREKNRQASIIKTYLDKLEPLFINKLKFWFFADQELVIKIFKTWCGMKKMLRLDVKKYQNRSVVYCDILFHHNDINTTTYKKEDIWISCMFTVFVIDTNGRIDNVKNLIQEFHIVWKSKDFKIIKFLPQLLNIVMLAIANKEVCLPKIDKTYYQISDVMLILKEQDLDLSELINPLTDIYLLMR